MESGEVFAWFVFLVIMNLLFFAAFGSQNISDNTIEEYIDSLMADEKPGGNSKWVWGNVVNVAGKQIFLEELRAFMLEKEMT